MNQNCNCNTNQQEDYLSCPVCPPNPDIPLPPPRPLPPMPGFPYPPPPKPGCGCGESTPNYGLPLWKASDVTSWLMQMNGAMLRIDTIMHDLALRTGINGLPDDLVTTVSKLCQDVQQLNSMTCELGNKTANMELLMQNMNTSFSAMKTDIASMQLSLTNFDTRLMTVDSANQQNKNDITLIKTDLNMLSKTVNALQQNFTQYQMATNQTLSEHSASIGNLETIVDNMSQFPSTRGAIFQVGGPVLKKLFSPVTEGVTISNINENSFIHLNPVTERIGRFILKTPAPFAISIPSSIGTSFEILLDLSTINRHGMIIQSTAADGMRKTTCISYDDTTVPTQLTCYPVADENGFITGLRLIWGNGVSMASIAGKDVNLFCEQFEFNVIYSSAATQEEYPEFVPDYNVSII